MTGPLVLALCRRVSTMRIVACSVDANDDPLSTLYPDVEASFFLPDGRVGAVPPEKVEAWRHENHQRLLDELGIDVLESDDRFRETDLSEFYPELPASFFLPDGRVGAVPPEMVEAWRREHPEWEARDEELDLGPIHGEGNLPDDLNVTFAEVRAIQQAEHEAGRVQRVGALGTVLCDPNPTRAEWRLFSPHASRPVSGQSRRG